MAQRFRNALIGSALGISAVLLVALLDGGFRTLFPSFISVRLGSIDLATGLVVVDLVVVFLAAGSIGQRIGGPGVLVGVVLPLAVLYVWAIVVAPYLYVCTPTRLFWECASVHSPFVIGALASCIGHALTKRRVVPNVV
jgi:hypothetical protein